MAKQCMYCGEPLPVEDARFCNGCGRSQIPSSEGGTAAPSPIKVKLPPKEFAREDLSSSWPESNRPGSGPASARPLQREQPPLPSSRLPKRPVRLTTQETQGEAQRSEAAFSRPTSFPPVKTPRPATEEESTMVLPGWQEELEQLRKERLAGSSFSPSSSSTEKNDNPVSQSAHPSAPRSPGSPLAPDKLPDPAARPREKVAFERPPSNHVPEPPARPAELPRRELQRPESPLVSRVPEPPARPAEPSRRELRVKVWEQEPTVQVPQVHEEKQESEPIPAVEQTPFATVPFDLEDEKQSADLATLHWETPAAPVRDAGSGAPHEKPRAEAVFEKVEKEDEVEDLPTVPLAVPQTVAGKPELTIERASTPAPAKWSAPPAEDDIEDLPTRPMAAASAEPRSPLPPAAQANPDQVAGRPASPQKAPGQLSSPGAPTAQPMGAFAASDASFEPAPPAQRPAQFGSAFDPASMPPLPRNPASLPGNAEPWPETPMPAQRPPSFASISPLPATPRPEPAALSDALSKTRRKKRASGKLVAILLVVLLVVGGGGFLAYYQLSSGGSILQPHQSYQVTALGVSLNYPQNWTAHVDQAHNVVHFADSSQTGQINLSRAEANSQTLSQYLNQQTAQLGITAPQVQPALTFAGSSWQRVQGNVNEKGATYMIVLYVTQHGGHFFALSCLSPLTAYSQMETDDFAPLRASFTFL